MSENNDESVWIPESTIPVASHKPWWRSWWAITEYVLIALAVLSYAALSFDGVGPDGLQNTARIVWWLSNTLAMVCGLTAASQLLLLAALPMIVAFKVPERWFKYHWVYNLLTGSLFVLGLAAVLFICFVLLIVLGLFSTNLYHRPNSELATAHNECSDSRYYCAATSLFIDPSDVTLYVYELHGLTMVLDTVDYDPTPPSSTYLSPESSRESIRGNNEGDADMTRNGSTGSDVSSSQSSIGEEVGSGATGDIQLPDELPTIRRVKKADFPAAIIIDVPSTSDDPALVVYQKAGSAHQNFYASSDGDEWILRSEIPCTSQVTSGFWVNGAGPNITFVDTNGHETACGSDDYGVTWSCSDLS